MTISGWCWLWTKLANCRLWQITKKLKFLHLFMLKSIWHFVKFDIFPPFSKFAGISIFSAFDIYWIKQLVICKHSDNSLWKLLIRSHSGYVSSYLAWLQSNSTFADFRGVKSYTNFGDRNCRQKDFRSKRDEWIYFGKAGLYENASYKWPIFEQFKGDCCPIFSCSDRPSKLRYYLIWWRAFKQNTKPTKNTK